MRKFQFLSIRSHVWLSHLGENFFRIRAATSGYLVEKSCTSSSAVSNRRFDTLEASCVPVFKALFPSSFLRTYGRPHPSHTVSS